MSAPGSGTSVHHHPAWFGVVMGTGALALVAAAQSETWDLPWLEIVAAVFLILATLAALLLWPRYLRRLTDREKLAAELSDPAHGAMLATFPAGLLVLAVAWGRVGAFVVGTDIAVIVDAVLLVVGASIATVVSAWWATSIGRSGVGLEGVNGGWLIPPVMNLIVPLAIVPLITANPGQAPWLVPVALAFWGIGAILFLALLAVLVARLAFRTPIAAPMAPSLWIPLARAGGQAFHCCGLCRPASRQVSFPNRSCHLAWSSRRRESDSVCGGRYSHGSTWFVPDATACRSTPDGGVSSFHSPRCPFPPPRWE